MDADEDATERAFLQAIIEAPDDDAPRLIYADWLGEHDKGDGKRAARAEFIRLQCELASLARDNPRWERLAAKAEGLLHQYYGEWARPLRAITQGCRVISFQRGFPTSAEMWVNKFIDHVAELFAAAPLQGMTLRFEGLNADQRHDQIHRLAACPYLRRLTNLTLDDRDITSGDVAVLASSPNVQNLTCLDLSRTSVLNRGATALVNSPHLQNLMHLRFAENSISYRLREEIERTLQDRCKRLLGRNGPAPPGRTS